MVNFASKILFWSLRRECFSSCRQRALPEAVRVASLQCCAFLFTGGKSERSGLWRFVGLNWQGVFLNYPRYPWFERLNDTWCIARSCACFLGVLSRNVKGISERRGRWRILLQILAAEQQGRAPRCRWQISAGRPELSLFAYWSGKSSRGLLLTWTLC